MPFALPEYDDAFARFTWDVVNALARSRSPILAELGPAVRDSTTVASSIRSRDGVELDLAGTSMAVALTMDVGAVRSGNVESYAQQIDAAAEKLEGRLVQHLFETLRQVTEATGMVTDAAGRPTFDALLEMLDRKEWSLTDDDELAMPTLLGGSSAIGQLSDLTGEQQRRLNDLLRRKHEDLLARRRRRRLS